MLSPGATAPDEHRARNPVFSTSCSRTESTGQHLKRTAFARDGFSNVRPPRETSPPLFHFQMSQLFTQLTPVPSPSRAACIIFVAFHRRTHHFHPALCKSERSPIPSCNTALCADLRRVGVLFSCPVVPPQSGCLTSASRLPRTTPTQLRRILFSTPKKYQQ